MLLKLVVQWTKGRSFVRVQHGCPKRTLHISLAQIEDYVLLLVNGVSMNDRPQPGLWWRQGNRRNVGHVACLLDCLNTIEAKTLKANPIPRCKQLPSGSARNTPNAE